MSVVEIISMLLEARSASATAGNRRSLYARMDEILAESTVRTESGWSSGAIRRGRTASARLAHMRLRNWKSFERAELEFPPVSPTKALVVIGGPNGYGKSSILEAYAFGLFGRRAVSHVGSVLSATGGRGELRRSYRSLVERALHRSERSRADGMASVMLEFDTDAGPIAIERKWYFDDAGSLMEEDEELLLRTGQDRHLVEVPNDSTALVWYQAEIERLVMPAGIAPFFIFDGEQVERWAQRRLSDQIRLAISRMLGLEELTGLAIDLRDYARDRDRHLPDGGLAPGADAIDEIERIEADLEERRTGLLGAEQVLKDARVERNDLLAALSAVDGGTHSSLQALLEEEHRLAAEKATIDRELIGAIADHGPLLLAGRALIATLREALTSSLAPETFEGFPGEIMDELWSRFLSAGTELEPRLAAETRERMERAWSLGSDQGGMPEAHRHLDRRARAQLLDRIDGGPAEGRRVLEAAAKAKKAIAKQVQENRLALAKGRLRLDDAERARIELVSVAARINAAQAVQSELSAAVDVLEQELAPRWEERARRAAAMVEAEPRLRAASTARALAETIAAETKRLEQCEHERFARAVTDNFRRLSHKAQVERIEIGTDGAVTILDARGRDLTEYRMSAGENQLFAMSLIAAVGEIAGEHLPLIVDTPLGRLDTEHRSSVLAMLAGRPAQTILLTQPEEIGSPLLAALEPQLALAATLAHSTDVASGVGVSSFQKATAFVREEAA
jgi:DNA sulfur modification protein DndD